MAINLSAFDTTKKKPTSTSSANGLNLSAFGIKKEEPKKTPTSTKIDTSFIPSASMKVDTSTPAISPTGISKPFTMADIVKTGGAILNTTKAAAKAFLTPTGIKDTTVAAQDATPGVISNMQRGASVAINRISPVINKIIEYANLPGQFTEFVTGGKVKSPTIDIKKSMFTEISDSLVEKSEENLEYDKILRSLVPEDTRPLSTKVQDPKYLSKLIGSNIPSLVASYGTGIATAPVGGPALGIITSLFSSSIQEGGAAYNDAKQYLESSEEPEFQKLAKDEKFLEDISSAVGIINGFIDVLPVSKMLTRSPQGAVIRQSLLKEITGVVIDQVKRHGTQALLEGTTESIQEIVSNAVARVYDKDRDMFQGVAEAFIAGSVLGGGASVAGDVTTGTINVAKKGVEEYQKLTPAQKQGGFVKVPGLNPKQVVAGHIAEAKDALVNLPVEEINKLGGEKALVERIKINAVDGLKAYGDTETANKIDVLNTNKINTIEQFEKVLTESGLTEPLQAPATVTDIANGVQPPVIDVEKEYAKITGNKKFENAVIRPVEEKKIVTKKTEAQILKDKLKTEAKTAKKTIKAVTPSIKEVITEQLTNTFEFQADQEMRKTENKLLKQKILDRDKYQTKLTNQKIKYETTIEDTKREQELTNLQNKIIQRMKDKAKTDIKDYAKENLPTSERGKFIEMVSKAENQKDIIKAFIRINQVSEQFKVKTLTKKIKETVNNAVDSSTIAVEYKDMIKGMVDNIELNRKSDKTLDSLRATQKYINDQRAKGADVSMPQKIMQQLNVLAKYPAEEIPSFRLETILNNIEMAVDLGKLKQKTREALYNIEKEKRSKEIVKDLTPLSTVDVLVKKPGGPELTAMEKFVNIFRRARQIVKKADAAITPMDTLFDMMSGGKAKYNQGASIIKNTQDIAYNAYVNMKDDIYSRTVEDIILPLDLDTQSMERIGIHAARMQEGGIEKLVNTGMTEAEIDAIILTDKELTAYNAMRKEFDALLEPIKKVMREVFNQDVKQVENYFSFMTDFEAMSEFEIQNSFGAQKLEDVSTEGVLNFTKKPELGFTKSRKGGKQKIKLDAVSIFTKHIDDAAYLINMSKDLKMNFEIINSPEFQEQSGELGYSMAKEWISLVARKGGTGGRGQIAIIDTLRRNVGVASMGFKLSSILIQPTALMDGSALVGGKWVFPAFGEYITNSEVRDFLYSSMPELREAVGDDPGFKELERDSNWAKFQNSGFWALKNMDKITRYAVAWGAYKKKMTEMGKDIDLTKPNKQAIEYAQLMTRKTQSSSVFKDVPLAMSAGKLTGSKSIDRALLQFQSFMLTRWALIRHDLPASIRNKDPKIAIRIASYIMLANLAETAIRDLAKNMIGALTGEEPEEEDYVKETLLNILGNMPFVNAVVGMIQYDSSIAPSLEAIKDTTNAIGRIATAKTDAAKEKAFVDFTAGIGTVIGMPGSIQSRQFIKSVIDSQKAATDASSDSLDLDLNLDLGLDLDLDLDL